MLNMEPTVFVKNNTEFTNSSSVQEDDWPGGHPLPEYEW